MTHAVTERQEFLGVALEISDNPDGFFIRLVTDNGESEWKPDNRIGLTWFDDGWFVALPSWRTPVFRPLVPFKLTYADVTT